MLNQQLLSVLTALAHAVAAHYGKNCETVIHDLTQDSAAEHSIVYIENGEVTGRKVGDGASKVVLEQLFQKDVQEKDHIGYFTKTADGKLLKSTTVYIKDEKGKPVAIFSVNHDITSLSVAASAIGEMVQPVEESRDSFEKITPNVGALLDELIWEATELVGKPVAMMNKEDKMRAIRYLNSKGALLITKSGDKISQHFGISKFTLYSYIDVNKEDPKND